MSPSTRSVAEFFRTSVWLLLELFSEQKVHVATPLLLTAATARAETIQHSWPTMDEKVVRIGRFTITST